MSSRRHERILVTGGAGYVGSRLVPRLLADGRSVRVLDLCLYGEEPLDAVADERSFELVRGDLRDEDVVRRSVDGMDAVIHLACISNDPSCDLDPDLTKSVNFDAFEPLVRLSKEAGVDRFVFASSASVYGVSDRREVTEDHPLKPVSLYNRYKGECEPILFAADDPGFTTVAVRPATICGVSPRQRLDLTVNILTTHAIEQSVITVFGGRQLRPNLHIDDMLDVYELLLDAPRDAVAGQAFNAGYENLAVADIAERVRAVVEGPNQERRVAIVTEPSDDPRSYHISSAKLEDTLGYRPRRNIEVAVRELASAIAEGRLPDAMRDDRYYNVRHMRRIGMR